MQFEKKVIILIGPTAVGKTEMAIRLAERMGGEIISADSRLLYRGMDIGTAKPSAQEMARVPHHLVNLVNPDEIWSLALYQERLTQKILEIQKPGKIPIIVGGTGQYIRSLVEGWVIPTVKPDERLRRVLEQWGCEIGAEELHRKVAILDPEAAARMDANNLRRSVRALEVIFNTGELFSKQKDKAAPGFEFKIIGLTRPREELYARVDERIDAMFSNGFVEEVQGLLKQGYSADLPAFSAIGYREVIQFLLGRGTLEDAKMQMRRKTREFIRRQANWFKPDDPAIEWRQMNPDPLEEIIRSITHWNKESE